MLTKLLTKLFLSRLKLPRDIHRFAFRKFSDRVMIQLDDQEITFGELQDRSFRLAQAWTAMGLQKGDVVFAQVDSSAEFFEIRIAALETGILVTSFHEAHTTEFQLHAASIAAPKLFIFKPRFGPDSAAMMAKKMPDLEIWKTGSGEAYEKAIANHLPQPSANVINPHDPMVLGFTSGTTGPPKGLISSHFAAIASLKLLIANLEIKRDRNAINIALTAIPLVGAGSGLIFPTCLTGGTLVVQKYYSPENLVALVKKYRVTRIFVTPSQLIDLLDMPTKIDNDLKTVGHIIYGTSSMPAEKLAEALKRFGPILQQGYGQAEVLPPVSLQTTSGHMIDGKIAPKHILQSCGKVVKGVEVRITDPNGNTCPIGKMGEILVKTPTRFSTYLNPDQNKNVILDDGFFRTGDHGFVDKGDYLTVMNRDADLIETPHGTLFPRIVEELAHEIPAVKECCLVPVNSKPVLFVSLRLAFATADQNQIKTEIQTLLTKNLQHWQTPDDIQFLDAIPRSFLGKIMRRDVKEAMKNEFST